MIRFLFDPNLDEYRNIEDQKTKEDILLKLKFRQNKFAKELENTLKGILPSGIYTIIRKGDWHSSGCTIVFRNHIGSLQVYKPKFPDSELFVQKVIEPLKGNLSINISIPEIENHGKFFFQKFIKGKATEIGGSYDLGALLAMGYWFGIIDLHKENLAPGPKGIVLYDIDCLFNSHPRLTPLERLINIGLFRLQPDTYKSGINALKYKMDKSVVLTGFSQALLVLMDVTKESIYNSMDTISVRKLLLPTHSYSSAISERYTNKWSDDEFAERWKVFRNKGTIFWGSDARNKIVECEIDDMLNFNIPFFYQRGNTLYSLSGNEMATNLKTPSVTFNRFHFQTRNNPIKVEKELSDLLTKFQ